MAMAMAMAPAPALALALAMAIETNKGDKRVFGYEPPFVNMRLG